MGESPKLPHDVLGSHDTLRCGLPAFKSDAVPVHPVQSLHQERIKFETETKRKLQERAYGSAFPLKQDIERQILSRFQRPGGLLQSSMLGLESLTGSLDEPHNSLNRLYDPRDSASFEPVDVHHAMEVRLGLSSGPPTRALI